MTALLFMQAVAATFVGCIFAAMFLWGLWTVTRLERQGYKDKDMPWRPFLFMLGPLVLSGVATYWLS